MADPPDIDLAMRLGAGHPYGPFERARALGLGSVVRGLAGLERRYGERYRVAPGALADRRRLSPGARTATIVTMQVPGA